jgi:hypothetical protein
VVIEVNILILGKYTVRCSVIKRQDSSHFHILNTYTCVCVCMYWIYTHRKRKRKSKYDKRKWKKI